MNTNGSLAEAAVAELLAKQAKKRGMNRHVNHPRPANDRVHSSVSIGSGDRSCSFIVSYSNDHPGELQIQSKDHDDYSTTVGLNHPLHVVESKMNTFINSVIKAQQSPSSEKSVNDTTPSSGMGR